MDKNDVHYIKPIRAFLLEWLNETLKGQVRVVQVGANDGTMADPLSPVIGRYGWSALLVEPVPQYFEALKAKYKDNDRTVLKNVAISATEGTHEIYHVARELEDEYPRWVRGLASFDRAHIEQAIKPEHVRSVTVPCYPLSQILSEAGFGDGHLMVVDVEGAEKLVFSSFTWAQFRPLMIEVETRHLDEKTRSWLFAHFHRGGYDIYDFGFDTIAMRRGWLPSSLRHLFGLTRLKEFKVG